MRRPGSAPWCLCANPFRVASLRRPGRARPAAATICEPFPNDRSGTSSRFGGRVQCRRSPPFAASRLCVNQYTAVVLGYRPISSHAKPRARKAEGRVNRGEPKRSVRTGRKGGNEVDVGQRPPAARRLLGVRRVRPGHGFTPWALNIVAVEPSLKVQRGDTWMCAGGRSHCRNCVGCY